MELNQLLAWGIGLAQAPLLLIWGLLTIYVVLLTGSAILAQARRPRWQAMRTHGPNTRFTILVPAHDEALVISECVRSLRAFDYPDEQWRVIVIADNCTDDTAALARTMGAHVYERTNPEQRGKGYALDWALSRLLHEDKGWTEAVIVFDADTLVEPQFLQAM